MRNNQEGFSITETLIALLLFSVGILGLLKCHQALNFSFQQQWHQREAWKVASQALLGENLPNWQTKLMVKTHIEGCALWESTVKSSLNRQASLQLLDCGNTL